jgi:NAD(P)H-dependent FMN reductase
MPIIKIIAGSTRPGRFNIQPSNWIYKLAQTRADIQVELVDLAEINLPLLDESKSAMMQDYEHEHTKKFSGIIQEADGFIFVTPEYNHSTSAALKNALDYLYHEWNYKPVSFISYGSLPGGARGVEHLRGIAAELKMYDLREQILLSSYWNNLNDKGEYQFTENLEKEANDLLDSLAYWARVMKPARDELQKR